MLFCIRVSTFRKNFLVKDSMCGVENDIFLYIAHKAIITIEDSELSQQRNFVLD